MKVSAEISTRRRQRRLGGADAVAPMGLSSVQVDRRRTKFSSVLAAGQRDVIAVVRNVEGHGDMS